MPSANPMVFSTETGPARTWHPSWLLSAAVARVLAWDAMSRSRKGLGRLEAHRLRDIGLRAAVAQEQAARPFWRR